MRVTYRIEEVSAGFEWRGRLKFRYVRICLWRTPVEEMFPASGTVVWMSDRVPAAGKTERSGIGVAMKVAEAMRDRLEELEGMEIQRIAPPVEECQPMLFAECGKRKLEVSR